MAAGGLEQRVKPVQHNLRLEHAAVWLLRPVQGDGAAYLAGGQGRRAHSGGDWQRGITRPGAQALLRAQKRGSPACASAQLETPRRQPATECSTGGLQDVICILCLNVIWRIYETPPYPPRTCTTELSSGCPLFQSTPASTTCSTSTSLAQ